jgi:hypothetical protein
MCNLMETSYKNSPNFASQKIKINEVYYVAKHFTAQGKH